MPFGTQSAFDTYTRNLYNAVSEVFFLSRSKFNETLTHGYGFRAYAALCAHLKNGPLESARMFDHAAPPSSLACLKD